MKAFVRVPKSLTLILIFFASFLVLLFVSPLILSPIVDRHRGDIEIYASQLLQTPVTIKKASLTWSYLRPTVLLDRVSLLDKNTRQPVIQVKQVRIFFSPLQSLLQFKPVQSGVLIAGSEVNVNESSTGDIMIQGVPPLTGFNDQPETREAKLSDTMTFLSTLPNLTLNAIDVRFTRQKQQKYFFTLKKLRIRNDGNDHVVFGNTILHQDDPTEAKIAIRWEGDKFDLATIKARMYISVSGLSLPQWLDKLEWRQWQVKNGAVSGKLWAVWEQGSFQKIQTNFQAEALHLYSVPNKTLHDIKRFSANFAWMKKDNQYIFSANDVLLDLPGHLWPITQFYLVLAKSPTGEFNPLRLKLGYLNLREVQTFLGMRNELPAELLKILTDLHPSGHVSDVNINFSNAWQDFKTNAIKATLSQISFTPTDQWPGVQNLSANVSWNGNIGNVEIKSTRFIISYPKWFLDPITLDQFVGNGSFSYINNLWRITTPQVHILDKDIAANVSGSIEIPQEVAASVVDLQSNLILHRLKNIARYLPLKIMGPGLSKWLQSAFKEGELKSGNVTFKGKLSDFPFENGTGTFTANANVNNVTLNYGENWPPLTHLNALVQFVGNKMTVTASKADVLGINLGPVQAEILQLDAEKPILTVQSKVIPVDFAQGLAFIHKSPLEETLGKSFSGMELSGPILFKLGLTVPLDNPDITNVRGEISFKQAELNLVPWSLRMTNLEGTIQFTENGVTSPSIHGILFNKPFTLNLEPLNRDGKDFISAKLENNLAISDLQTWLKIPFDKVVSGNTDVKWEIIFALNSPPEIHLQSNLVGVKVDLPQEYGKFSAEARDFSADIIAQENAPLKVRLNYAKQLSAALILTRQKDEFKLQSANLQLGEGVADWPTDPGLTITARFNVLDWKKIQEYLAQSPDDSKIDLPLQRINVQADRLQLGGLTLNQAVISARPQENLWDVDIQSSNVNGNIQAPKQFSADGHIRATFQRINLSSEGTSSGDNLDITTSTLPAISLVIQNLSIDGNSLGRLTFESETSGAVLIKQLRIQSNNVDLQANGRWDQGKGGGFTHLNGSAVSSNVSAFLESFGLNVRNFVAKNGKLNFNLRWAGPPFSPTTASLDGRASLELGPGQIVDVGAASGAKMEIGKMLSIFSLQTIPRRLMFDFSDVTQKGYVFDSVKGDFDLRDGNAYTNNLFFNGPVAKVGIDGRIGFRNKDFDLILSVTPLVTSSIPLAATLLGQPLIGLAALAVTTVMSSQMSKATGYTYAVKGPWSNPSWNTVSGKGR